jgi:hypothetical protein
MISIGFEVLAKFVTVLGGQFAEMSEELFDLLAGGVAQRPYLAEVSGVAFNLGGIEVLLTNEEAKPVAQTRLAIAVGILVAALRPILGTRQRDGSGKGRFGAAANLIGRAEADAVGLAEGSVDSACLGHPHLSAADEA